MRRFVASSVRLLASEGWSPAVLERWQLIWTKEGGALNATDPKVPSSIRYHIVDIWLEELSKVVLSLRQEAKAAVEASSTSSSNLSEKKNRLPLLELLQPFIRAIALTDAKVLYGKIYAGIFEPLLRATETIGAESLADAAHTTVLPILLASTNGDYATGSGPDGDQDVAAVARPSRIEGLRSELIKALYAEAGQETCRGSNRHKLYAIHISERDRVETLEDEGVLPLRADEEGDGK